LGAILLGIFAYLLIHKHGSNWYLLTFLVFCYALLLIAPWAIPEHLIPGFALMSGEVSWIRRYSAEITFYGALIPLLISASMYLRNSVATPKEKVEKKVSIKKKR
jgi:hypothetical protein